MTRGSPTFEELLTPGEVGAMFRVDPSRVAIWARCGKIPATAVIVTPGGHRRYKRGQIEALRDRIGKP